MLNAAQFPVKETGSVLIRLLLSLLVTLVVGFGTVEVWKSLSRYQQNQVARITTSESWAARSQLIRNVERSLQALQSMQSLWLADSQTAAAEWISEADAAIALQAGVTTVIWDDPANEVHVARVSNVPGFDFRSGEAQLRQNQGLLERARKAGNDTLAGPFTAADGRVWFELYLVDRIASGAGRLAAVVDARAFLQPMLQDESPGYAVKVTWGETVLYERGEPAAGIPADWASEGKIQSTLGSLWNVTHAPTRELADSFAAPAIDLILLLGLVISVLMGTLTFENWRAQSRARAAEVAERKLAELNRNLEQQIHDRTRELANRTADLQTIADSVAHDMRNPLNVISVNLSLFEAREGASLQAESMTVLQRIPPAVKRMADILNRLLGLSTVAHSTFKRELLDMREMVQEVFNDLQASETDPDIVLHLGDLHPVQADEKLVGILLLNLLANAFRYTRGRPDRCIEVNSKREDGVVVYTIRDNGIGFDQHHADRIFNAFDQLETGQAKRGLGLGLAIVARVVSRHKGRIWAESAPNEFAAFHFTLEPIPERT
jgi:signal transduction histidine kinase